MQDKLGDRMKLYEAASKMVLPRRTYTVIRVDGRCFHTLLKKAKKPFDYYFVATMDIVAQEMCKNIGNAVLAYTQSDEISIVLQDFKTHATEPWFGGVVQKQTSIAASLATYYFNHNGYGEMGLFDARVYSISSKTEVMNYLLWRQKDAIRNSVSMAAQSMFSHKELQSKSTLQMLEMMGPGTWDNFPVRVRRGGLCKRYYEPVTDSWIDRANVRQTKTSQRSRWLTKDAPVFEATKGSYLDELLPTLE